MPKRLINFLPPAGRLFSAIDYSSALNDSGRTAIKIHHKSDKSDGKKKIS